MKKNKKITTMKWLNCSWQCNHCRKRYNHYTTFCRDGCGRTNISDAKGNLIKNESQSTQNTPGPDLEKISGNQI